MFLSQPEIDSGLTLIVLENQEKNKTLRGCLCTQAKEFINAVFVLKWRPLETSSEMKEGWENEHNAGG